MNTAGQILNQARLSRKLEIADVVKATKIRTEFISALERDDYLKLPNSTVTRGFIRNYSELLGLNAENVLAVFRRDFIENKEGQIVPRGMVHPVSRGFIWTPKATIIAATAIIFVLFGSYLFYQYRLLSGPPSLTLSEPAGDGEVSETNLVVSGKTDPEATISVNGQKVILEKGGKFFFRIPLQSGLNTISVTAISKSGKTTTLTRRIILR